jgi:hypothetical protein
MGRTIPFSELQSQCPSASRSAVELVQQETDSLAASLIRRALSAQSDHLKADDIWEALYSDPSLNWLAEEMELRPDAVVSLGRLDPPQSIHPPPLSPPQSIRPSIANGAPRIIWRPASRDAAPIHAALVEASSSCGRHLGASSDTGESRRLHRSLLVDNT